MKKIYYSLFIFLLLISILAFQREISPSPEPSTPLNTPENTSIVLGAEQFDQYLPLIQEKKVALVVNHTSSLQGAHLVDTLLSRGVSIQKVFAPEHGFRGQADAGEQLDNEKDAQTGLSIISLYGKNKKPLAQDLADVDILIFDIQDVGTRFYTYISTMHYVMEACAENNKECIILDRPNPNGDYIDGPILDPKYRSFVGLHPIPIVHGLTVGELARMINGEKWLKGGRSCSLKVIPMRNYSHESPYELPIKPSPNLPNAQSIQLYPSLCLFEGTAMSVGRGTKFPFQVVGAPEAGLGSFTFKPQSIPGMSRYPKYENKNCYGKDYRKASFEKKINLKPLLSFYKKYPKKEAFFNSYFNTLVGTDRLQKQVQAHWSESAIRKTWAPGLKKYRSLRQKYVLYP